MNKKKLYIGIGIILILILIYVIPSFFSFNKHNNQDKKEELNISGIENITIKPYQYRLSNDKTYAIVCATDIDVCKLYNLKNKTSVSFEDYIISEVSLYTQSHICSFKEAINKKIPALDYKTIEEIYAEKYGISLKEFKGLYNGIITIKKNSC